MIASDDIAWPALRAMLYAMPEVQVVGEAFTPAHALDVATGLEPDVIIAPAELEGQSSLDLIRRLRQRCPQAVLVVLSSRFIPEELAAYAEAGVRAYLLWTDLDIDILEQCLNVAMSGDVMIGSARVGEAFFEAVLKKTYAEATLQLTPRERSILDLMARDFTDKEIAASLEISPSTVGSHIQNLCAKLGAKTRFGLAISAVTKGLMPTG